MQLPHDYQISMKFNRLLTAFSMDFSSKLCSNSLNASTVLNGICFDLAYSVNTLNSLFFSSSLCILTILPFLIRLSSITPILVKIWTVLLFSIFNWSKASEDDSFIWFGKFTHSVEGSLIRGSAEEFWSIWEIVYQNQHVPIQLKCFHLTFRFFDHQNSVNMFDHQTNCLRTVHCLRLPLTNQPQHHQILLAFFYFFSSRWTV